MMVTAQKYCNEEFTSGNGMTSTGGISLQDSVIQVLGQ